MTSAQMRSQKGWNGGIHYSIIPVFQSHSLLLRGGIDPLNFSFLCAMIGVTRKDEEKVRESVEVDKGVLTDVLGTGETDKRTLSPTAHCASQMKM